MRNNEVTKRYRRSRFGKHATGIATCDAGKQRSVFGGLGVCPRDVPSIGVVPLGNVKTLSVPLVICDQYPPHDIAGIAQVVVVVAIPSVLIGWAFRVQG